MARAPPERRQRHHHSARVWAQSACRPSVSPHTVQPKALLASDTPTRGRGRYIARAGQCDHTGLHRDSRYQRDTSVPPATTSRGGSTFSGRTAIELIDVAYCALYLSVSMRADLSPGLTWQSTQGQLSRRLPGLDSALSTCDGADPRARGWSSERHIDVGFPPVMSVGSCNCLRHARRFRLLLSGRPIQGRPVRRLVRHRRAHHRRSTAGPAARCARRSPGNMRFYLTGGGRRRPVSAPASAAGPTPRRAHRSGMRGDVVARAMRLIADGTR